jgi:VIT1/CCC1 family predicted Fe2+/Mn2+ transporter
VLEGIARDELRHYEFFRTLTGRDVPPRRLSALFFYAVSRLLGLTFGTKLMELAEERARAGYGELARVVPGMAEIEADEGRHESELLAMLDEERLRYAGSVVLGLSDALVELTGMLAGLTLALANARLIAATGLITGAAASLSMAASEYLSTKSEDEGGKSPAKAALYTGSAYVLAVAMLITPYFLSADVYRALGFTVGAAILLIFAFSYYISVAKSLPFWRRFIEMALVSLGVAAASFGIGALVRQYLPVEI